MPGLDLLQVVSCRLFVGEYAHPGFTPVRYSSTELHLAPSLRSGARGIQYGWVKPQNFAVRGIAGTYSFRDRGARGPAIMFPTILLVRDRGRPHQDRKEVSAFSGQTTSMVRQQAVSDSRNLGSVLSEVWQRPAIGGPNSTYFSLPEQQSDSLFLPDRTFVHDQPNSCDKMSPTTEQIASFLSGLGLSAQQVDGAIMHQGQYAESALGALYPEAVDFPGTQAYTDSVKVN